MYSEQLTKYISDIDNHLAQLEKRLASTEFCLLESRRQHLDEGIIVHYELLTTRTRQLIERWMIVRERTVDQLNRLNAN